ncbi:MAG: translation elongation factor Ts [Actinobacteria bacterium]|nr:translation elongation factor Ts [Actinomycetota bacterium]
MTISAAQVRELREATGAGMMSCKEALIEAEGDIEKAVKILREKGLASLKKKAGRTAQEGVIESYIHAGGKLGVLVEINCETDFVAKNEDFKKFTHDIAMQIAAANPLYISREDVPADLLEKERDVYRTQAQNEGKSGAVVERIVEGKIEKFYKEICLLEQQFVKDPDITISGLLGNLAAKLGENIVLRRFIRFSLGETSS